MRKLSLYKMAAIGFFLFCREIVINVHSLSRILL